MTTVRYVDSSVPCHWTSSAQLSQTRGVTSISSPSASRAGWRATAGADRPGGAGRRLADGLLGPADGHDFGYHLRPGSTWSDNGGRGCGFRSGRRFGPTVWPTIVLFYPPLARLVGAFLLLVLRRMALGLYVLLVMFGAGAAMFALARRWLPGPRAGRRSLLCRQSLPVALHLPARGGGGDADRRFFPLVLLFADELPDRRAAAPLALVFAACWISDFPAAVLSPTSWRSRC